MSVFSRALDVPTEVSTHQTCLPLIALDDGGVKSGSTHAAPGLLMSGPPPQYWMPIGWSFDRSVSSIASELGELISLPVLPTRAPAHDQARPSTPPPSAA